MKLIFQPIFIFLSFFLLCHQILEAHNPSIYLSDEVWEQVQDYLIPNHHPMKEKLDAIFSHSRALANPEAMVEAGFESAQPEQMTRIVVTRHPELPGYVIKAYLDSTKNGPKNRPEQDFFIKRVIGSRLVKASIEAHHYEHLLKVPEKWLYLLPDEPSTTHPNSIRRMFILIEDDMDIYNDKANKKLWKGNKVNQKLLKALYTVVAEVRLSDTTNARNCPFSKDGRVALIDTQMYHSKTVKYEKLTPYLSPSMKTYWEKLTRHKNQREFR